MSFMDMDAVVRQVAASPLVTDGALAAYAIELADVGEPDLGLITLLESAPQAFSSELVSEIECHFEGSGEYAEREALNAVTKYRQLQAA